jgi:hypothetical protein
MANPFLSVHSATMVKRVFKTRLQHLLNGMNSDDKQKVMQICSKINKPPNDGAPLLLVDIEYLHYMIGLKDWGNVEYFLGFHAWN